jgi:hypothetical protein
MMVALNVHYKGDKWLNDEVRQLCKLCELGYSIKMIAETTESEVASRRTVHTKIFELCIYVIKDGRFQLLARKY